MRDTLPLLDRIPFPALTRGRLETLQINVGYRCNQSCVHCHVGASPHRTEEMQDDIADLVLKVQRPTVQALSALGHGVKLAAILSPHAEPELLKSYADAGVDAFAMDLMPRITRAQSMDVLSSQSNLAGYKAVLDAAAEYGRAFPMMMTAAGTVQAARADARGRSVAGNIVMTPWEGRWSDVQVRDGMRVPLTGEVAWLTPEGRKPYWRGTIASVRYEFAP